MNEAVNVTTWGVRKKPEQQTKGSQTRLDMTPPELSEEVTAHLRYGSLAEGELYYRACSYVLERDNDVIIAFPYPTPDIVYHVSNQTMGIWTALTGATASTWPCSGRKELWLECTPNITAGSYLGTEYFSPFVFQHAQQTLNSFRNLEKGWDSYDAEPPNTVALLLSHRVLMRLQEWHLQPTDIAPSREEGVTFSFFQRNKWAAIECYNTGEMAAVISETKGDPQVWMIENKDFAIGAAILKIQTFFNS